MTAVEDSYYIIMHKAMRQSRLQCSGSAKETGFHYEEHGSWTQEHLIIVECGNIFIPQVVHSIYSHIAGVSLDFNQNEGSHQIWCRSGANLFHPSKRNPASNKKSLSSHECLMYRRHEDQVMDLS
jgi:hypothetical protein